VALPDVAAFARRHRLTVNTLVQGAWALLLARYGGSDDVVFGVTVAGRPAELTEVERTVGLFINTLPLRIAVRPARRCSTASWCSRTIRPSCPRRCPGMRFAWT
jgi:non-ribosomal peptide synthetase component F